MRASTEDSHQKTCIKRGCGTRPCWFKVGFLQESCYVFISSVNCDSSESTALGAPYTWSELGTLGHESANAYLSTPTQFSSVQILKYIDCQFIRQLDVKEGHFIHLILWKQKEEVEGEAECNLHFQTCPSRDTLVSDQSRAISGREAVGSL